MRAPILLFTFFIIATAQTTPRLPEPEIKQRALASIMAAMVADAAAMPLHWIYDVNQIKQLVGNGVPEFFNPPSCPFYKYQPGWSSPYGQQTVSHIAVGANGTFRPTEIEASYFFRWGPRSIADKESWYFDKSTKEFVANENLGIHWPKCGGNDNQADALAHMIPVVALYAGSSEEMLLNVDTVIRVTQDTDDAVAFGLAGARILEKLMIYNITGFAAVQATIADMTAANRSQPYPEDASLAQGLQAALDALGTPNLDYCLQIGQSCDYPNNLWTGGHLIAQLNGTASAYVDAIRQTILAGGDSASRGMFVGAMQAARVGSLDTIPASWVASTGVYASVLPLAQALVNARGGSRVTKIVKS